MGVWSQLVERVMKAPEEKRTLVVLGDREAGKSTLLDRLQGTSEDLQHLSVDQLRDLVRRKSSAELPKDLIGRMNVEQLREEIGRRGRGGISYEYGFIPVKNPDDIHGDAVSTYNVWVGNGEAGKLKSVFETMGNIKLLSQANEASVADPSAEPVVTPLVMFLVVIDLSKPWLALDSAKAWLESARQFVDNAGYSFHNLIESQRLYYREFRATDGFNEPIDDEAVKGVRIEHEALMPEKAIGLPLVLVGTKSDTLTGNAEYDLLQKELRKLTYAYGGALIYTSTEGSCEESFEMLMQYIDHRMFGFDFGLKEEVVDNGRVFVPFGWDTRAKINGAYGGGKTFGTAFPAPMNSSRGLAKPTGSSGKKSKPKKPLDHDLFLRELKNKREKTNQRVDQKTFGHDKRQELQTMLDRRAAGAGGGAGGGGLPVAANAARKTDELTENAADFYDRILKGK